jgi:Asp/Glu/hydantoin racemase
MTDGTRKVLVLVPFPMDPEQLAKRAEQQEEAELPSSIELHYRSTRAAPSGYVSAHDYVLADITLLEAGMRAEEEGYDAVCIDTVSDSGVAALRSLFTIPVIAPGKTMFMTALMLGRRFGVLSMWERWFGLYERTLRDLAIEDRCAGIRSIDTHPDSRNLLDGKEDEVLPRLHEVALQLIEEDGADVICLGSTTMHQAHGYLQERLAVPVLNPGPLSYLTAEAMLALGLSHSRKAYPQPLEPKPEMISAMLTAATDIESTP